MIYAFTSCALNYTPKSRALLRSLKEHAPDIKVCLALADEEAGLREELLQHFDYIYPFREIPELNDEGWIFRHRIVELATAIKPFVLKEILKRDDCEACIYFDPDMVIFSDLTDMIEQIRNNDLVLTPHLTDPEHTHRGIEDNELSALKHGTYNLGYVGVNNNAEGKRFADWWATRLKTWCREDIPAGIFTDQKWIDLVPGFFDNVKICRHPGWNVASWNMTNREITKTDDGRYMVNDKPLVFYHFTGFDSGSHDVMSEIYSGGSSVVKELVQWYRDTTAVLSKEPMAQVKWAYLDYSDGTKISAQEREVYRTRVDLQAAYPNPFDASASGGPESFKGWWKTSGQREYGVSSDAGASTADALPAAFSRPPAPKRSPFRLVGAGFKFLLSGKYRRSLLSLMKQNYRLWGLKGVLGMF